MLQSTDLLPLYAYLGGLSPLSRSRFAPHSFDWDFIKEIRLENDHPLKRFVAVPADQSNIVAYILLLPGLEPGDLSRYKRRGQHIKPETSASFAPSVAEDWQGSGLAISLSNYVETVAFDLGIRELVLWGGVQATNHRAIHFYEKIGYQRKGNFYFNGMDNIDMSKTLTRQS